jgi:hypothetical protein
LPAATGVTMNDGMAPPEYEESNAEADVFVPIAFAKDPSANLATHPAAHPEKVKAGIHTVEGATITVKHTGQTRMSVTGKMAVIMSGEAVIIANDQAFVRVGKGVLHLQPGAIVSVNVTKGSAYVRNIYEPASKGVEVIVGPKRTVVTLGNELILVPPSEKMDRTFVDGIGRRKLARYEERGSGVYVSEVSLISLIMNSEILTKIFHSEVPEDKSLSSELLKMAACVSIVTANHGTFGQAKEIGAKR